MGAAERRSRPRVGLLAIGAVVFACAAAQQPPEPLPPQAVSQHRPEPAPPVPAATPTPPPPTLVIVDPGGPEVESTASLAEAAQREKERRQGADKPVVTLTNKNLAEFAKGQKLTVAEESAATPEAPAVADDTANAEKEKYWRERGLEIRRRWRDAADSVERLEEESAGLRRQFYSTDDPYVRDNQIKPEWDRVLAELDRARRTVAEAPHELDAFLDEGRRAGALPGWLREGIEIEPEAPAESPDSADPQEPKVLDEGPPPS